MSDAFDPHAALSVAIEAARLTSPTIESGDRVFAFVPQSHALKDISDPLRLPPRIRQSATFDDAASVSAYINRFSDRASVLLADYNTLQIRAVLDYHADNQDPDGPQMAGACEHEAILQLLPSEEFLRWAAMEGKMHPQAEFAEFLEENAVDIAEPTPASMIEISRDLEATVGASFKARTRLENGDRAFVYETETKVKGDVVVPTKFALAIPVFNGEEPEILEARFRFRPQADGIMLGFVWHRIEYRRRAHFNTIAHRIAEETGVPVFAGRAAARGGAQ